MAIIRNHFCETISKKYKCVKNNGGFIQFQTSISNNGEYSRLHKIAKLVNELTQGNSECKLTKFDIINKFSDRQFTSNTTARGHFWSYFRFLNINDIVTYSSVTKTWSIGSRINEFLNDVDYFKSNNITLK